MKICKQCEAVNSDDARICENCGSLLENSSSQNLEELSSQFQKDPDTTNDKIRCPYCGEEILAVAKKCKHCGEWLENKSPREAVSQSAQTGIAEVETAPNNAEEGKRAGWFSFYVFRHFNFNWRKPECISNGEYIKCVIPLIFLLFPFMVLVIVINQLLDGALGEDATIWIALVPLIYLQTKAMMARVRDTGEKWWRLLVPFSQVLRQPGTAVDPRVKWAKRDWLVVVVVVALSAGGIMYSDYLREESRYSGEEYNLDDYNYDTEASQYSVTDIEQEVKGMFDSEETFLYATNVSLEQQDDSTYCGSIEIASVNDDTETSVLPITVIYNGETISYKIQEE